MVWNSVGETGPGTALNVQDNSYHGSFCATESDTKGGSHYGRTKTAKSGVNLSQKQNNFPR